MVLTVTATLPILTTGALGQYRNPQVGFMYTQGLDNNGNPILAPAVANTNLVNLINVTGTATSTNNTSTIVNNALRGANIFLNISNISASSTVALNVQSQDPSSNAWITVYRTSLDQIQTGGTQENLVQIYPGVVSVAQANMFLSNAHMGLNWRAQVSITSGTTSGNVPNIAYQLSVTQLI